VSAVAIVSPAADGDVEQGGRGRASCHQGRKVRRRGIEPIDQRLYGTPIGGIAEPGLLDVRANRRHAGCWLQPAQALAVEPPCRIEQRRTIAAQVQSGCFSKASKATGAKPRRPP